MKKYPLHLRKTQRRIYFEPPTDASPLFFPDDILSITLQGDGVLRVYSADEFNRLRELLDTDDGADILRMILTNCERFEFTRAGASVTKRYWEGRIPDADCYLLVLENGKRVITDEAHADLVASWEKPPKEPGKPPLRYTYEQEGKRYVCRVTQGTAYIAYIVMGGGGFAVDEVASGRIWIEDETEEVIGISDSAAGADAMIDRYIKRCQ